MKLVLRDCQERLLTDCFLGTGCQGYEVEGKGTPLEEYCFVDVAVSVEGQWG